MRKTAVVFQLCFLFLAAAACFGQTSTEIGSSELIIVSDPSPWSGSVAAGLNGKSGNSQSVDMNLEMNWVRETDTRKTDLIANYFYSTNQLATVTDRFFGQAREERKIRQGRLSVFAQTGINWDRFKNYDYRISLHSGFSYEVIKEDDRFFTTRLGAGASKEVGAVIDDWIPELQIGADWERKITDTFKTYCTVDYYPSFNDFAEYRVNTNAGLEFLIDWKKDINFRIFAFNRYDSTPPAGNVGSDLDYGFALAFGF
ncbi:MAG: DUF481 domain-containing protein [Pirellulales bacterium]